MAEKSKKDTVNKQVTKEVLNEQAVTPSVEVAPAVPNLEAKPEPEVAKKDAKKAKSKKAKSVVEKSLDELVKETNRGVYGTGRERMLLLGSRYSEVQTEITKRLRQASK